MDREPNAREKEIAKELFSILNHSKLPDADLFEKGMVESLASYRAELRPEPTVGDMAAAEIERLESAINEAYCREGDDGVPLVRDLLQAALSAARGNRAELEAAAREIIKRFGTKGQRHWAGCIERAAALERLAALVKAEEVGK